VDNVRSDADVLATCFIGPESKKGLLSFSWQQTFANIGGEGGIPCKPLIYKKNFPK
jgi:hypothetical protein